jgi:uncharacterized RDD family membrane protein YckC
MSVPSAVRLIDPDPYDASEQEFAASIEEKSARAQFVVDQEEVPVETQAGGDSHSALVTAEKAAQPGESVLQSARGNSGAAAPETSLQPELLTLQDPDSWRREVAARVNHYRASRHPRAPRYPSLQLKFDPLEFSRNTAPGSSRLAVARQEALPMEEQTLQAETDSVPDRLDVTEAGAKILEFPRSAAAPSPLLDELADPVMDRPRILEAPELLPPPPALGGILIEPAEEAATERRPGFELPLQAAPMARRLWAGAIDSLLVISALTGFAYIFFRLTTVVPPLQQAAGIAVALSAVFWIAYQYLLLVYTGTTPGLMLAKLQLSRFDGSAVPRNTRRWRVLASALSGMSLALGYAWCFLDEDRLCWHDRITRTYMAPQATLESEVKPEPSLETGDHVLTVLDS